MKTTRKLSWLLPFVLVSSICAGGWALGQVRRTQDRYQVAKMTENMKTVCVGRFLIDVPAQAGVGLSRETIAGFSIKTVEEGDLAFRKRIAAREADIVSRGPDPDGNGDGGMVEARDLRVRGMTGRAFIYGYSRGYLMSGDRRVDMESVSVELHAHIDGLSFSLAAKSTQESSAKEAEALLARLQPRAEEEIPAVPGFRIRRAVFAQPLPPHTTEHIVMHIGLPNHPELGMAFASLPGGGGTRGLLMRVAEMDANASLQEMLRVTKLRTDKRDVNGMPGEEGLERVREFNFARTFGFMWETEGVKDDFLRPFLSLELHAGISPEPGAKPADSSLHEDAVLTLWDTISSSIRLRPSGPRPPAGPAAEQRTLPAASRHPRCAA